MRFIYRRGKGSKRRVMHIERFTPTGENTMEALCGIAYAFNTSINISGGRRICKNCNKVVGVRGSGDG